MAVKEKFDATREYEAISRQLAVKLEALEPPTENFGDHFRTIDSFLAAAVESLDQLARKVAGDEVMLAAIDKKRCEHRHTRGEIRAHIRKLQVAGIA